jgi:hypothetical protein
VRRHPRPGTIALFLAIATAHPAAAPAQVLDSGMVRGAPSLVHYGKWVTLAATIGMGIKAAQAHRDADAAYSRLGQYCAANPPACDHPGGGPYVDPQAEAYYQNTLRSDRRARSWLLGGEIALLGTAGLFVWELTRPSGPPRNIPFAPTLTVLPTETRLGMRAAF